ncbi:MAG: hypothetical protein A3I63_09920 [Betaproteobacteria bacterium RIFCSPLOWO2_02_FULL_66_14]|nr:MAG: hypothetical protein A3I63_09920 [Betaproteobacteria bacterium RIFCSPLOWO2_02_FULL_66_14]
MPLSPASLAAYISAYIQSYRAAHSRLTAAPPQGSGYPDLVVSPYLAPSHFECFLALDGVAVMVSGNEPPYSWWLAGGPALMVDLPESQTPPEVTQLLSNSGLLGKPIGIYRIVTKAPLAPDTVYGRFDELTTAVQVSVLDSTVTVRSGTISLSTLLERLTFGAFGPILDIHLPSADSDFWRPHIIRNLGFMTADRRNRRFLNYLEIMPHVDDAAWDQRSIPTRVGSDLRRDFGISFAGSRSGGILSFGGPADWNPPFMDRLASLGVTIAAFERLLRTQPGAPESTYQDFLAQHPILLDVYGEPIPKPRFIFPDGPTPLGKAYVEPDFVIRYPGNAYRLIELERPTKGIATQAGHPKAEMTQSAFQIAEWRQFIARHYSELKERFPGISAKHPATVVISRTTERSYPSESDLQQYKDLLLHHYENIDVLTYDDLLVRAKEAHARLAAIGVPGPLGA